MSNLSNVKNFIGVDISKDTLDICVLNYKLAKQGNDTNPINPQTTTC